MFPGSNYWNIFRGHGYSVAAMYQGYYMAAESFDLCFVLHSKKTAETLQTSEEMCQSPLHFFHRIIVTHKGCSHYEYQVTCNSSIARARCT